MKNKRLILTIALFTSIILIGAVAIVAILAAGQQTLTSKISVKYTAQHVSATVSAKYYVGESLGVDFTDNENGGGNTEVSFDSTNSEKMLYPGTSNIELGVGQKFVLEYKFVNNSNTSQILIGLNETSTLSGGINMLVTYGSQETSLATSNIISQTNANKITGSSYSSVVLNSKSTTYIYIVIAVEDFADDASISANIIWNMDRYTPGPVEDYISGGEINSSNMASFKGENLVIPAEVNGGAVTTIGSEALLGNENVKSVSIPASVTSIGLNAFSYCSNLTTITVDENNPNYSSPEGSNCIIETATNTLIAGCNGTVIPEGVSTIADGAFEGCEKLQSIEIPASVTSLPESLFEACISLTTITVDEDNTKYSSPEGSNCIIEDETNTLVAGCNGTVIPNTVKILGIGAFRGYTNPTLNLPEGITTLSDKVFVSAGLTEIVLPSTVTSMGANCFTSATSLKTIELNDGLESMGNRAFSGCSSLESIVIPGSVTTIGEYAFHTCKTLSSVTFNEGLQSIGYLCFNACTSLVSVTLPASLTTLGNNAFWNCRSLQRVNFAENSELETISVAAFSRCSTLNNVNLPASVKTIKRKAFESCEGLTTITLSEGLTIIEDEAFLGSGLTSIHLPASLIELGFAVFKNCLSLTTVSFADNSVFKKLGESCFQSSGLTTITLPAGMERIGIQAFYKSNLNSLTIPSSVVYIGKSAFLECTNLQEFYFENTTNWVQWGFDGEAEQTSWISSYTPQDNLAMISGWRGGYYFKRIVE